KRVAGNGKLLEKIWRRFKAEHAKDISKLRAAIDNNNHDDERRLIHTLKGVTGNIGAEKLYQFIDKLGRNRPDEEALQKLETLLIKTLLEIETHLENSHR
ncbi:MAG TPA: Hpt domain-containing protein, partial [Thiothrix sp.]|nr:Hpt domain-containing protein [Thiothrix sp.]